MKVNPKLHEVLLVASAAVAVAGWLLGQLSTLTTVDAGTALALVAGVLSRLHATQK